MYEKCSYIQTHIYMYLNSCQIFKSLSQLEMKAPFSFFCTLTKTYCSPVFFQI